jgi:hypothetical protein
MNNQDGKMNLSEIAKLLEILQTRFEQNMNRHAAVIWDDVLEKLQANPGKLRSLYEMERTGGEPDVILNDQESGTYVFCDCSAQSPAGRRSVCYDQEALETRKKNRPEASALDMAASMGIELLSELQYRELQQIGSFDTTTSSWVKTPEEIRKLGGAIFCDRRYDTVFTYHNSAGSYYSDRGFRGRITV